MAASLQLGDEMTYLPRAVIYVRIDVESDLEIIGVVCLPVSLQYFSVHVSEARVFPALNRTA